MKHMWCRLQEEPRQVQDKQIILRHCQKDLDSCRSQMKPQKKHMNDQIQKCL